MTRNPVFVLLAALGIATFGCSQSNDKSGGGFVGGDKDAIAGGDGSLGDESGFGGDDALIGLDTAPPMEVSADAFFADDPPPKMCGGGVIPVVPGGTPECPDDKNREGCRCPKEGTTAACWPGFRKNRNRGDCKDGMTTCKRKDETNLAWGPCEGYVLPTGTMGKAACTCFSGGSWKIANLSPCFFSDATGVIGAVSTLPTYDATGKVTKIDCPAMFSKPPGSWSKTTLNVDCAGHFKLCFTIKAGDSKMPKAADCVVTKQCAEGDYKDVGKDQVWADLPAWINMDPACSKQFNSGGGYGEMSVEGTSVECDAVNKVFQRVPYCPSKCNDPAHAMDADCKACGSGGGGSF